MVYLNHRILTMTYHQPVLETSDQLNDTEILSGQRCLRRCAEIQSGFCACCCSIFGVARLKMELLQRTQEYEYESKLWTPQEWTCEFETETKRFFRVVVVRHKSQPVKICFGCYILEAVQLDLSGKSASRPHSQVINILGWDYYGPIL